MEKGVARRNQQAALSLPSLVRAGEMGEMGDKGNYHSTRYSLRPVGPNGGNGTAVSSVNATPRTQIVYNWTEQGEMVAAMRQTEPSGSTEAHKLLAALDHYKRVKANMLASEVVEGGEPLEFRTTYQSDFVKMVPIDKY
jgi:hypothetical protein